MAIKVGSLCWLKGLSLDLAQYNGRVVEIVGPLAVYNTTHGLQLAYKIDADWLRGLGIFGPAGVCVAPENLLPFSDPDQESDERWREPIAPQRPVTA